VKRVHAKIEERTHEAREISPPYVELWSSGQLARRVELGLQKFAACRSARATALRCTMSQFRKDVFTGRWVIIAETDTVHRDQFSFKRSSREAAFCPFCQGHEASTPPEIFAIRPYGSPPNGPDWTVRVVPNLQLRLRIEEALHRRPEGFHDMMDGIGADEIIVETPSHDRCLHQLEVHQIRDIIRTWASRIRDLEQDKRIRYVLIFKNHGDEAGAHTITHSISELMALPVTPRIIKSKLMLARDYYALKDRCIYCDVLHQELNDHPRVVAENRDFVALTPFASGYPFELTLFPKEHASSFSQISPSQTESLASLLRLVLQRLDSALGDPPYNLSVQDRPFLRPREGYWKTVEEDFHWHLEVLPQLIGLTGFERATRFFYNPVPPELAARCLMSADVHEEEELLAVHS
jgi:UDPglucose--hexose-1-phosphate uridylyltransferase